MAGEPIDLNGPSPMTASATTSVSRREHLVRRALWLAVFTVIWNLAEGAIAITAAVLAGSKALIGFGVDSFVESASAAVLIWRQGTSMRNTAIAIMALGLVACGGGDDDNTASQPASADASAAPADDDGGSGGEDSGGGGDAIVNQQPAGQALVSVDGQEYTMQEPGALACTIAEDTITFSFRLGDNEVTLGAGANRYDTGWLGSITTTVGNPAGETGPISHFPDLAANGDGLAIDGSSLSYSGPMQKQSANDGSNPPPVDGSGLSYSGPMQKQSANDGSNPPPVDVGEGIISVTCR